MNINDLTIGQAKELAKLFGDSGGSNSETFFEVGKNYFIRTVTMNQTGKLVAFNQQELVLENAAWIADSGRFNEALLDSDKMKEIEMYPSGARVIVGRGAIVDAVQINTIPSSSK